VRRKDDNKHQAICDAAIDLITKNGFADTSMSKIAKAANVSPATIYVYFENREDLLNKLYLFVKQEMSAELLRGVKDSHSTEESFKIIWNNFYNYAIENPVRFAFTEQFANSPMVANCRSESMDFFKPLLDLFVRGVEAKVFKDIPLEIFNAFTFSPLMGLVKEHLSGQIVLDKAALATAYEIAWDAVTN
jgi:AcrR family transcriptional regulator